MSERVSTRSDPGSRQAFAGSITISIHCKPELKLQATLIYFPQRKATDPAFYSWNMLAEYAEVKHSAAYVLQSSSANVTWHASLAVTFARSILRAVSQHAYYQSIRTIVSAV